jgi:molybdopterin/thiamine biosynthesis adenylyltransferase
MTEAKAHPADLQAIAIMIVLVGGGNIGSSVLPHIARNPLVTRILIVDPDTVSRSNTNSQEFLSRDIGQYKAHVLARRARQIRPEPSFRAEAIVARIGDVPMGLLRKAAAILGCVDCRLSRGDINRVAWRTGNCFVDAGINADGALARVETHIPSADSPCIQCAWGARDRELLAHSYACDGRLKEPAPTGASSSLGGLAASLQALEVDKILRGSFEQSLAAKQLIVEGKFHHNYVNTLRRNPACTFDHTIWSIEKAPASVRTVRDLVNHGRELFGGELPAALRVERKSWVTRLACRDCGGQARAFRLQGRLGQKRGHCNKCGGEMQPIGFYLRPHIDVREASDQLLARPLRNLGLRCGDVLTLSNEQGDRHVEINPAAEPGGN